MGKFSEFISKLHSLVVPTLATIWIIAMIILWQWNVEGTGLWFAFTMVFLGVIILVASLLRTFLPDKTSNFFSNLIYKIIDFFKGRKK